MKSKTETRGAPVFDALDFPLESFVLFKDGRQWKDTAQDRKALFVQIAKHGATAWPGINGLMRKTGFSRAKLFRLLNDLKELGCIADATDSKGRKYSGEHGSRVRVVVNDALLKQGQATGWLSFKGANLLIRIVSGVSNSQESNEAGVSNSEAEVSDSSSVVSDSASRSLTYEETQKNLQKEQTERTNPNPKEPNGGTVSLSDQLTFEGRAALRLTLRKIADVWQEWFVKELPERYPATPMSVLKEWAKTGNNFQQFTDSDYKELRELLKHESETALIKRWAVFIRTKWESKKDWEGVKFPFGVFVRQP